MENTFWRGYDFSVMSDSFLLESFDELCVLTDHRNDSSDQYMAKWRGCKEEIMKRLKELRELQVEKEALELARKDD